MNEFLAIDASHWAISSGGNCLALSNPFRDAIGESRNNMIKYNPVECHAVLLLRALPLVIFVLAPAEKSGKTSGVDICLLVTIKGN